MKNRFIDWVVGRISRRTNKKINFLIYLAVFLIGIMPIISLGVFSGIVEYRELGDSVILKKQAVADLSSALVKERFDHMVDIGKSITSRELMVNMAKNDKWDQLEEILKSMLKDSEFIDGVFISDIKGNVMAVTPQSDVVGQNFAYRDWFRGVSKNWEPYVSEVYQRANEPKYNIISVALPIKDENESVLAILVMQIKLDVFFGWVNEFKEKGTIESGAISFIDKNGNIIAHPDISPQGNIINVLSDLVVQKVLKGEKGVEVFFDQNERYNKLVAYEMVDGYNVGILVSQSEDEAFALRDRNLYFNIVVYGFFVLVDMGLIIMVIRVLRSLSYSRRKEEVFLESIGDGIVAIDKNWNIISWNKSASRISGWEPNEVMGKPFREIIKFIRGSDREEDVVFVEEAMLYGKVVQMSEGMILMTKDKKEVPVGDTAAPIFDESGSISGVIIIFRNITRELESMRIRSDFAYASHQMRTPVNEALWSIESALRSRSTKTMREALNLSYLAISKMRKIVTSLIEVSRIDQNMISPKIQMEKLIDILEELIKSVSDDAAKNNVSIKTSVISPIVGIKTDAVLLKGVLSEVLENAIFYSNSGGEVNINMAFQEQGVLFEIKDAGIGIPEDQQSLVFTKFFRGQNIPSRIVGAGLGLYIAKEYLKMLNGKIWFKSEKDKGTTFSIFLPDENKE